jgi:4-aminobutyrate aminotransferase-like enzyme
VEVTPRSLTRAYLCNSGAESIEAALKFARLHTGRTRVLTLTPVRDIGLFPLPRLKRSSLW